MRTPVLFMGAPPSTIATLPKAHLLTSPCWVLGSQHMNLKGGGGGVSLKHPDITRAGHDTCCRDSQSRDPKLRVNKVSLGSDF